MVLLYGPRDEKLQYPTAENAALSARISLALDVFARCEVRKKEGILIFLDDREAGVRKRSGLHACSGTHVWHAYSIPAKAQPFRF